MYQDQSDAQVFYATRIIWAVLPIIASLLCVLVWLLLSKFKKIKDLEKKIKASVVILLYLLWPGLSSQTFSLFACRDVCGESRLRADINEPCYVEGGRHLLFAYALGIPMTLVYVIGLPLLALILVIRVQRRSKEQGRELHKMKGHYVFGLFYSAYHPDVWWWESTVALRKIVISLIGVFGESMGQMQVHLTAYLMVIIMMLTAIVRPFGDHLLLHCLDIAALGAVWMTLWAGSVFNDHPRCEDGMGGTLAWCNVLSIVVGVLIILCLVLVVAVIVYYKKKSREAAKKRARERESGVAGEDTSGAINETSIIELTGEEMKVFDFDKDSMESNPMNQRREEGEESSGAARPGMTMNPVVEENEVEISQDISTGSVKPKKQRRLSSRELMREQRSHPVKNVEMTEMTTVSIGEVDAAAPIEMQENPHWSKLKKSVHTTSVFKAGGKKRTKRLSQVVKARHNSATGENVDEIESSNITMHVDNAKKSFRRLETSEGGRNYYQNKESGETVWTVPEGADVQ